MLASFLWSYLLGHSGFSLLVKAENPPPHIPEQPSD